MKCHARDGSILELARLFFGFLKTTDMNVEASNVGCAAQPGLDQTKFQDEIRYLRAFAIYYSTCVILGESPEGNGLRSAFMRTWDKASRTGAMDMDSYNEFFKRIELYGGLVDTDGSVPPAQAADRISRKFAELLGDRLDAPSLAKFATCASAHFNSTCAAVAEALKKTEIGASMSL